MSTPHLPPCPQCSSVLVYPDGDLYICPECGHEWSAVTHAPQRDFESDADLVSEVKDANGTVLANGDSVVVIKDLKIKGAGSGIKSGTKVRNIRIIAPIDGHNISCKIDGVGAIHLKSEFVKKS